MLSKISVTTQSPSTKSVTSFMNWESGNQFLTNQFSWCLTGWGLTDTSNLSGLTPLCLSDTESLGLGVATWQQEAVGISRLRDGGRWWPPALAKVSWLLTS